MTSVGIGAANVNSVVDGTTDEAVCGAVGGSNIVLRIEQA